MKVRASLRRRFEFARRFRRNDRGATAVEFALVATPFLALLMGIVELALAFTASVALDNAVQAASREIRTGELQSPTGASAQEISRQAFRDEICDGMGFMESDCKSNLYVDVSTVSQFSSVSLSDPIQNGAFDPGALNFQTGSASSIVLVRCYYRWHLFAPLMNQALVKLNDETLLTSVTTFRNEPYNL